MPRTTRSAATFFSDKGGMLVPPASALHSRRIAPQWLNFEHALGAAGLLIFFGILNPLTGTEAAGGSRSFQIIAGSSYLAAVVIVLARGMPLWALEVLRRSWPLVALTLLPLLSTVWSQSPDDTLRRAIALILSSTFGIFLMIRFDLRALFVLITFTTVLIMVLALTWVVVNPDSSFMSGLYVGALRAFYGNKNEFGRVMALSFVLIAVGMLLGLVRRRWLALPVALTAFTLLLLSQSATSLLAAVGSLIFGATIYLLFGGVVGRTRIRLELGLPILFIVIGVGFFAVLYGLPLLLEVLGRDATLTGRTKLWDWAIRINNARPWLGSGYEAFWIDENTKYFSEVFYWRQDPDGNNLPFAGPSHAHSGYVDIYLELGWLGITALALTLLCTFLLLVRALKHSIECGFVLCTILTFMLIYAAAEGALLQQSDDVWLLFITFYLFAVKELVLSKVRPMAARPVLAIGTRAGKVGTRAGKVCSTSLQRSSAQPA